MFFFLPISTDAPVYHLPLATVGLIVCNLVVFVAMLAGAIDPMQGWVLTHGQGLRPLEWLLSSFTHAGIFHLLGNMVFLWVFGLVVEGKLGWARFLACYLFVGVGESAVEQLLMLGYSGAEPSVSLGASTAIYGVMAMAAVWAPKNEIGVFYFVWFFFVATGTAEIAIGWLAGLYIGWDLLWLLLSGGGMGTSLLHVSGAAIGFPLGILLLKRGVVDCEGWDMFHAWRDDLGGHEEKARQDAQFTQDLEQNRQRLAADRGEAAKSQVGAYLKAGNAEAAAKLIDKLQESGTHVKLGVEELSALVRGLHKAKQWKKSAPLMAKLIKLAPERADPLRLKLAQICVVELDRPGRALDLVSEINVERLSPENRQQVERVTRKACKMQSEGHVELDDGGW